MNMGKVKTVEGESGGWEGQRNRQKGNMAGIRGHLGEAWKLSEAKGSWILCG